MFLHLAQATSADNGSLIASEDCGEVVSSFSHRSLPSVPPPTAINSSHVFGFQWAPGGILVNGPAALPTDHSLEPRPQPFEPQPVRPYTPLRTYNCTAREGWDYAPPVIFQHQTHMIDGEEVEHITSLPVNPKSPHAAMLLLGARVGYER